MPETAPALVARALRVARARGELTQARLANLSGVSRETISRAERRDVVPSLAVLEKIATAVGLGLVELLQLGTEDASH